MKTSLPNDATAPPRWARIYFIFSFGKMRDERPCYASNTD